MEFDDLTAAYVTYATGKIFARKRDKGARRDVDVSEMSPNGAVQKLSCELMAARMLLREYDSHTWDRRDGVGSGRRRDYKKIFSNLSAPKPAWRCV